MLDWKICKSPKSLALNIFRLLIFIIFISSCEDNSSHLANFKSAKIPISTAFNIRTVHTDSGLVSSVVHSPKMLNYSNANFPYYEFPENIIINLYDKNKNLTKISSNYAISYVNTDIIDLRGDVVISTHIGDTLFTQQLYYDRGQEWLFTNLEFEYASVDKKIYGIGFNSDKTFEKIKFLEVNGYFSVDE